MSRRPTRRLREDILAAWRASGLAGPGDSPAPSLDALAEDLYGRWFCGAGEEARSTPPAAAPGSEPASPSLLSRLRAAHAASERFEPGWTVSAVGAGGLVSARRDGEELTLLPPDYLVAARTAVPARTGDSVEVTTRRDGVDADNAWWVSLAAAGDPTSGPVARIYWNCPHESIDDLVAGLTGLLEAASVPYSMKCPILAELFDRRDPVVVYLSIEGWKGLRREIRDLHSTLAARLREAVPPLTLALGRGVAVAEDPGGGVSFGQSRTRAVADGLLRCVASEIDGDDEIVATVLDTLAAHDISPQRPHQKASSPVRLIPAW